MNAKKPTMEDRLLHLLKRKWVTPLDALHAVNCLSLSQRVSEFIRGGVDVQKRWVDLPSGKRVRAYRIA
jgi:hypothetical protein